MPEIFSFDDDPEEEVKDGEEKVEKQEVLGGFDDPFEVIEEPVEPKAEETTVEEESSEKKIVSEAETPVITPQADPAQVAEINQLKQQVDQLQQQAKPEPDKAEIPELPTEEDWELDPKAAAEKMSDINLSKFKADQAKENDEKFHRQKQQEVFENTQNQAWREIAQLSPEIMEKDSEMSLATAEVYKNGGFQNHPLGPLAAGAIAMLAKAQMMVSQGDNGNNPARDEGAQLERSRQARLNQGTMTDGGASGSDDGIVLDATHLAVAKQMGISPEIYKQSLKALK